LCEHGLEDAVLLVKKAIQKRVPMPKAFDRRGRAHRNTWYLENVCILQEKSLPRLGLKFVWLHFFEKEPTFCETSGHALEFEKPLAQPSKFIALNAFWIA